MTISKDLFLAILSMDAYNRGYAAGISDGGAGDTDGLGDAVGTQIGNATIAAKSSSEANSDGVAAGFYAVAYDTQYGKVISYRGTDNPDILGSADGASDVWKGWITGAGIPGWQSSLALEFFKTVTGSDAPQGEAGGVILAKHSLDRTMLRPVGYVRRYAVSSRSVRVCEAARQVDGKSASCPLHRGEDGSRAGFLIHTLPALA